MPRQKGTPKTGGRKKGTPNKVTASTKDWVQTIIDSNRDQLEKDLKDLDPVDRWRIAEKLMGYIIPKVSAVDANLNFSNLSDEQLDRVVNELLNRIEDENQ